MEGVAGDAVARDLAVGPVALAANLDARNADVAGARADEHRRVARDACRVGAGPAAAKRDGRVARMVEARPRVPSLGNARRCERRPDALGPVAREHLVAFPAARARLVELVLGEGD